MRKIFTIAAALCLATPSLAQISDQKPGFFDRLFQSDEAQTDEDQGGFLERLIEDNLSGAGRVVQITGFAGALQGRATLDSMTIADESGVWFSLNDAVLDWNRTALLRGRLEIAEITAGEIQLFRRPATTETAAPSPEAQGFSLPELPVSIAIDVIGAERVLIGEPVIGTEIDVSLSGALGLADGEGAATLSVQRRDDKGSMTLEASYANTTRVLGLDFALTEDPGGILTTLLGLPGSPAVDFLASGNGPINDYTADIRLRTDGIDRVAGQIKTFESEGTATYSADLGGDIAALFAPDFQPFFGSNAQLRTEIQRHGDGRTTLTDMSVNARSLSLTGTADIGADGLPRTIRLSGQIQNRDGGPVLLPVQGAATKVDRVDLAIDFDSALGEAWTGEFQITGLDTPSLQASALTLEGSGQIASQPRKTVSANFNFEAFDLDFGATNAAQGLGRKLAGSARINWAEDTPLELASLRVDGETFRLQTSAQATFSDDGPDIEGQARIAVDRLSAFSGLAGRPLSGKAEIETEFTASPMSGMFSVVAKGIGQDVAVGQAALDAVMVGQVVLDVSASRDETGIIAELRSLNSSAAQLSGRANLTSGGSDVALIGALADIALVAPGLSGPANLRFEGQETEDRDWDLSAAITSNDVALSANGRLASPYTAPGFTGTLSASSKDVSPFSTLANRPLAGSLSVKADGAVVFDLTEFSVVAEVTGQDLSIGQRETDLMLGGRLLAQITASGSKDRITITQLTAETDRLSSDIAGHVSKDATDLELTAQLANTALFVPGLSGPLSLSAKVERNGQDPFAVDVLANGPGGSQAKVSGTLAADASQADLALSGRAPLALADRFIAPRAVSGDVGFDLRLNGPLGLSSLSGNVSTARARVVDPELGIALSDIAANATLSSGRVDLNLSGQKDGGGRLTINGPISLSAPYTADLGIRLNAFSLSDARLFETTIDGTIGVSGPLVGGAAISGALALGPTDIRVPSSGFGGAGDIPEILHINEPPPARRTRSRAGLVVSASNDASAANRPDYPLDITVTAPRQIFIRGRGLESEFAGQLQLRGSTANVVPSGAFGLVRGRLDILGRRLELDEARVTMQGAFEPYLNLRASTQAEDYRVNVLVTGPASNPEITFTSDPDLPQEEVIARLIFGRGLANLSPFQAAQLALAVRTLAGQGGEGVVGRIRSATGLADLDVVTGENGSTAVRAGAYINDNLYTDVTVDSAGETELNLNLDLTPSITLKGGVSNSGSSSIGVFFERDY